MRIGIAKRAGGGGSAPSSATFIIQTANASLPSAQVLDDLTAGVIRVSSAGVLQTAVAGTDFVGGQASVGVVASSVPRATAAGLLADSLLTISDTPVTATLYDSTAVTGVTRLVIRDGAGQASSDAVRITNSSGTTVGRLINAAGDFRVWNGSNTGITFSGSTNAQIQVNSGDEFQFTATQFAIPSDNLIAFSSTTSPGGTKDIGLSRNAAGVLEINTGTAGRFRDLILRHLVGGAVATHAPAPTITSGFGTSPSIAGTDTAGRVTVGTGGTAQTGVITFGTAYAIAPAVMAMNESTGLLLTAVATTTTITLTSATPWTAADKLTWITVGY